MQKLKPLIPGSNVFKKPAYFDLETADLPTQIEIGMASKSASWHWSEAGYKPHEKQLQFHSLESKFRAFVGGVGSGKTLAGAAEAVKQAISQPGSVGIIAAPTYKMLQSSTKPEFYKILRRESIARKNDSGDNFVELTNGSIIWFRSTEDPDMIRGINATWFWLDEGAYSSGRSWDIMVGRLRQVSYHHCAWVTTTPKGKNWLYDKFAGPKATEQYKWVQASSRDNPHLTADFVVSLEGSYGAGTQFALQEIEGRFTVNEGLVYPAFDPHIHVLDEEGLEAVMPRIKQYVGGVDWGFRNLAVVLVFGVDGDDRLYLVDEWAVSHALIDDQIDAAKQFQEKYGKMKFICDPAEPGFIKQFNQAGLWAVEGYNPIMEGVKEVSARLATQTDGKPRLFISKHCEITWDEFTKYEYPENKEGKPVKEEPIKENDHCLDALRYVCMSMKKNAKWRLNNALDRVV